MLHYGNDIRLSEIEIRGVGLGLSNVKRYVDSHHGEFTVESEQGKESSFIIRLPHRQ